MLFNSVDFLVFMLVFYAVYRWIGAKSLKGRNAWILVGSYFFYGYWDYRFLSLIALSTAVDYFLALRIQRTDPGSVRKRLLATSVVLNLGLLFVFKYFGFFYESFIHAFGLNPSTHLSLKIILPVGISFYTFQTLSYTIDVYRREAKAENNFLAFASYVSFFPQLVAGPIERSKNMLPQFSSRVNLNEKQTSDGFRLILWGLFKKLVLADNLGLLTQYCFEHNGNAFMVLAGALAFGFQIYYDFSAYSEIARGLAKVLGFELMVNFNLPYHARSLRDFWSRWHISLSQWFRDYLYIPLGGNRGTKPKVYTNLLVTFLISGLWHGAKWTFVIWGAIHGVVLILERVFNWSKFRFYPFIVLMVVFLAWIPFVSQDVKSMATSFQSLISVQSYAAPEWSGILAVMPRPELIALLVILIATLIFERRLNHTDFARFTTALSKSKQYLFYNLLVLLILIMVELSNKPDFIYFKF